jgi:pilus assembly protein CpaB
MGRSRLMVLALAVIAALGAVVLARNLGNQGPVDPAVVTVNNVPMSEVLVATMDIPLGDKVETSKLTWAEWPRDAVRPWMITKEAKPEARTELENARARAQMFEGEPVSTQKLVLPNTSGFMAAVLPKGMRAISVAISAETGAGGFILPNDRVDVLLTSKQDGGGTSRSISETILSNVRVLAIDQTFQTSDKGEQVVVGKTATLELEPAQTEVVAYAEQSGQLSLTLRSIADNGESELGDTGPRLSDRFAKGQRRNEVTINRYGVARTLNN